jgi:hypothetical protein
MIRNAARWVVGLSLISLGTIARGDDPASPPASEVTLENAKAKVLQWVDEHRRDQVLFHDDDIVRLRERLSQDTPEAALQWWHKTANLRKALDSPEWKETSQWLGEFLRVQAIFTDQEVDEFRREAKDAAQQGTDQQFMEMLAKVEAYRASLVRGAASDRALRAHKLEIVEAFKKEPAAQRAETAKAAAFGTTSPRQPPPTPRPPRAPSAPLINSLDVARWSVMRNFWRY